ncbi:phosphoketolase family protein [Marinicella rhabdoformis]|uniref:phosphoketolase family protein n=1 Tax=Marinicella rhabdoformis TaxID=2580566 RepID=UPI0012AEC2A4|nr:phosphoketolase family protein [Marinicella rhabdoformis]
MKINTKQLSSEEIKSLEQYWSLANYLSVGQIYLLDNPLLKEPLTLKHIKPRLLGHWGTTPGLNLIYIHLNRIIVKTESKMLFITGPGHGGPALIANTYIEGSYSKFYPQIELNEKGLKQLFKQFSFPGGIPSHVAPETPGSIHEGGELGYALSHAYGAAFDNPDLIVTCVIGDGEAETGPLAASWHSNKFLNPIRDGAVLPILHLNGYKIANPTLLARIPKEELMNLFQGYGYEPILVESNDTHKIHQLMADALSYAVSRIKTIQSEAKIDGIKNRPVWPMIILKTPKGWTGPQKVAGLPVEGNWRSHQVPFKDLDQHPELVVMLDEWLKSYQPNNLFDDDGRIKADIQDLLPRPSLQMGQSPHGNGGLLMKELNIPLIDDFAVQFESRGVAKTSATKMLGKYLAVVMKSNMKNFRVFGPDETASNRLDDIYEVSQKTWLANTETQDDNLDTEGRVMEILSEHTCQGWLEGYLLTGRHGLFSCYEAFINIVTSMATQHAKWLKVASQEIPWRKPIPSLNYLLTSHVWRQDHNGFSHQDPGFIDHLSNKDPEVIRIYFPPDANTLLAVGQKALKSTNKINVIVAGKQPQLQWLTQEEAIEHCNQGLGEWTWVSNIENEKPELIMASAGDVPTIESLAATKILNELLPDLKIKFINVVNIMRLAGKASNPEGIDDEAFNHLFNPHVPIIFAFHGYPSMIHRLVYKRRCHLNFHVHGFNEQGTTTTPFDMLVLNKLDRFHLVKSAINQLKEVTNKTELIELMDKQLTRHNEHIVLRGDDLPEIKNFIWE